jgi:putative ABC transport system permease protein
MLVTVVERTQEIGLRKALGATPRAIVQQFLAEAMLVGLLGGLVGVGLGLGLAALVRAVSPLPAAVAPWSLALGVALSSAVGLASGVLPARRAAALAPVEALRYE